MINGIINIYKEQGFTSFDVIAKLRGILKQKKIGHTGTLDPDAVGVLPVCLGSATKLCDVLTDKTKEYVAEFILGKTTDTQDISGTVLEEHPVNCTQEQIKECVMGFTGLQSQIPPMYSAIKVNGKKLYELAREGKEVERKAREITIYEIEILKLVIPNIKIRVKCSKGTYIRTLCHDIGQRLNCGAVMTSLERTQSGMFTKEKALTLKQVEELRDSGELLQHILPVDFVFMGYPEVIATDETLKKVMNGNLVLKREWTQINDDTDGALYRIYKQEDNQKTFLALYEYCVEKKGFKPNKMFWSRKDNDADYNRSNKDIITN